MIKFIKLINCQSWKEGVIPLAQDTINVLKADNNSGKSVFFKMLKITACPNYYTPKERKKLIRNGCNSADIIYFFTDESIGVCRVYPTRVLYLFSEDGENFEKYQEPPQRLISNLGIVHNADRFIANIIDMDQSLLLVDSNLYDNYELIKLLTEHPELNDLKTKLIANIDDFEEKSSDLNVEKLALDNLLEGITYEDINKLQANVTLAENCFTTLESLDELSGFLLKLQKNWVDYINFNLLFEQMTILETLMRTLQLTKSIIFKKEITQYQIDTVDFILKYSESLAKLHSVKQVDYVYVQNLYQSLENISLLDKTLNAIKIEKVFDYSVLDDELNSLYLLKRFSSALDIIEVCNGDFLIIAQQKLNAVFWIKTLHTCLQNVQIISDNLEICEKQYDAVSLLNKFNVVLSKFKFIKDVDSGDILLSAADFTSALTKLFLDIQRNCKMATDSATTIKSLQNELERKCTFLECPRFGKVLYNGQECLHDILVEVEN